MNILNTIVFVMGYLGVGYIYIRDHMHVMVILLHA